MRTWYLPNSPGGITAALLTTPPATANTASEWRFANASEKANNGEVSRLSLVGIRGVTSFAAPGSTSDCDAPPFDFGGVLYTELLSGIFSAAEWTLRERCRASGGAGVSQNRDRWLVSKGVATDGSDATLLTPAHLLSNQVGIATADTQDYVTTWDAPEIELRGERLFFSLAKQLMVATTTSGGGNTRDAMLQVGVALASIAGPDLMPLPPVGLEETVGMIPA